MFGSVVSLIIALHRHLSPSASSPHLQLHKFLLYNCITVIDIMPLCFCVSHGCFSAGDTDLILHKPRGKNVDTCTFKAHSVADRQTALCVAEQNTEATIDTQIEEITTYLSASVLADKVSRLSKQSPGGSLWLRHNDSEDCPPQDKPIATPKQAYP